LTVNPLMYPCRTLPPIQVNTTVDTLGAAAMGFDSFRRAFWLKSSQAILGAFDADPFRRVAGVRLCPLSSEVRNTFLQRLRSFPPQEKDIELVYHGTRVHEINSICARGLLPPVLPNVAWLKSSSEAGYGLITTTRLAMNATYEAKGCQTIFVCAGYGRAPLTPNTASTIHVEETNRS
jgi:hypothetical protein